RERRGELACEVVDTDESPVDSDLLGRQRQLHRLVERIAHAMRMPDARMPGAERQEADLLRSPHHSVRSTLLTAQPFRTAGVRERWAWTNWTAIAPSPTAVAQRLVEPERTSPAANTPGMSVSSRLSVLAAAPVRMKPLWSRATVSSSHSVHGSAPRKRNMKEYARSSPLLSVTAARCPSWPWSAAISLRSRTRT